MLKMAYICTAAFMLSAIVPATAFAGCKEDKCKQYCNDAGYNTTTQQGAALYQACFSGCIGNIGECQVEA